MWSLLSSSSLQIPSGRNTHFGSYGLCDRRRVILLVFFFLFIFISCHLRRSRTATSRRKRVFIFYYYRPVYVFRVRNKYAYNNAMGNAPGSVRYDCAAQNETRRSDGFFFFFLLSPRINAPHAARRPARRVVFIRLRSPRSLRAEHSARGHVTRSVVLDSEIAFWPRLSNDFTLEKKKKSIRLNGNVLHRMI